jgi:hypothetical protein
MIIVGQGALSARTGAGYAAWRRQHRAGRRHGRTGPRDEGWNGFNVLHTAAARVRGP